MDLEDLQKYGQSVWLDYIRRDLLASGEFARLVREEGLRGVTTNPTIFERAIAGSTVYDGAIERDVRTTGAPVPAIYEHLIVDDIQHAADVLRPVYEATDRRDGYVSMEVAPHLARDSRATLEQARRLWVTVHRENLMIKIPATAEGIPVIERLVADGINVNVTLLFGRGMYLRVLDAYMSGLESRAKRGANLSDVASVASMFISRIDTLVDRLLAAQPVPATGAAQAPWKGLAGRVAVANARLAYQDFKDICGGARWRHLAESGARAQRLLWASTSTKDPRLSDVLYVESLIGPDTVDTLPLKTLEAFRDHGKAENRLEEGIADATSVMATLARTGISIDEITEQLLDEGVSEFSSAFDALMASIGTKRDGVLVRLAKAKKSGQNSTEPAAAIREPKPIVVKVSRVDHRDSAGHLDPAYAARLEERTSRRAHGDENPATVGDTWAADSNAEKSAEQFIMSVTSGEDAGAAMLGAVTPEENGGPFVETSAATEFAFGSDRSNPAGATKEPFPRS
jgi:transaldolase